MGRRFPTLEPLDRVDSFQCSKNVAPRVEQGLSGKLIRMCRSDER
jgi:hypothetical protein